MKSLIVIAALALVSTGCGIIHGDNEPHDVDPLIGHTFEVQELNGVAFETIDGNSKPTMKFQERHGSIIVSGNATCNIYNGHLTTTGDKFIVDKIVSTRMMCAGGGTVIERELLDLLNSGSQFEIDEDTDSFTIKNSAASFKFVKIDEADGEDDDD